MMKKTALILSMFVLAVLLLVMPASADTISLVLSNPVQSAVPGSTLWFDATVSAPLSNAATVYLNSDDFGITGTSTIDDSGFLSYFVSVDPGETLTANLFSVTLPPDLAVGVPYNGFFTLVGGGPNDFNNLVTVDFQINTVPEPGTWVLLATGLGALAMAIFGRRSLAQTATT